MNICADLQNYMFTSKNMDEYSKHIIRFSDSPRLLADSPRLLADSPRLLADSPRLLADSPRLLADSPRLLDDDIAKRVSHKSDTIADVAVKQPPKIKKKETMYKPKQKDSLFWCFYILKNGYFNYEMEINNQYFVVEKAEKFKYIEKVRQQKALLKLHKLKPLTEIEDDLANKPRISIKTFFALCVLENINILLVNKRKIYELLCVDINDQHPVNIVHRNGETYEHQIELDVTDDILQKYRDTYFKVSSFDATLKSIGSYKLEELLELCKKLDISIDTTKKIKKKDIYEMLVLQY
jgi:hypothetical protein